MCSMVRILHADLDAFYASVEQRDAPRLRGRAIAVGEGIVLAASYEARRHGVRTAMTGRQARRLCPGLRFVPPRMEAYSEASRAVFEVFHQTTPLVEPLSIDEAFLDVTGLGRVVGDERTVATRLRQRVRREVGLSVSVGGGSTKFLAKVASAVSKPDGLLLVPAGGETAFLHPLPVERLWGVGPTTAGRLREFGIETVAQVATLEADTLAGLIGRAAGHHLHALAHNRDPRPVEVGRRRRSIGSQRSFPAHLGDRASAEAVLLETTDRVARRLRAGGRVGCTVVLRLRFADYASATRSRTLVEATAETSILADAGRRLLDEVWPTVVDRGLTKLGVAVTGLAPDGAVQLALPFTKVETGRLDQAVDEIRRRFGPEAVGRTRLLGRDQREMPLLPDPAPGRAGPTDDRGGD